MTEDSTIAVVFDLRRYEGNALDDEYKLTFKRFGPFEVPVLPESRFKLTEPGEICESCNIPFQATLEEIRKVYVVSLADTPPAMIGWRRLYRLFPNAEISKIPLGRTDWNPIREEENARDIISAINATDRVDQGEKTQVGPFTLFLFRNKQEGCPASILVTGESREHPFAFFFGDEALEKFFPPADRVEPQPAKLHSLSAGDWYSFYSPSESPPVKELVNEQT